jgi:BRCT domain type II-containing protein
MNNNNNNDHGKTDPLKHGASVQPIRDEQGKQASAPAKPQGDAETAKREASGTGSAATSTDSSAK